MYGFLNNRPQLNRKVFEDFLGEPSEDWEDYVSGDANDSNKKYRFLKRYVDNLTVRFSPNTRTLYHHYFEIKNKNNRYIYHILFLTSILKNLENMKRAMVNKSQGQREFIFSEWSAKNGIIDGNQMSAEKIIQILIGTIKKEFNGRIVRGGDIFRFIIIHTPFICNMRRKLKEYLQNYVVSLPSERRFDHMVFDFSNTELSEA